MEGKFLNKGPVLFWNEHATQNKKTSLVSKSQK